MANLPPPSPGIDLAQGVGFTWLTQAYNTLRQLITGSNQALSTVTIASGVGYTAPLAGTLIVSGGSVTSITFKRQGTVTTLGITNGSVPVSQGDIITLIYSSAPTIYFIPR